jgi:hopene-associated glycosyltransferase HpnB
MGTSIMNIAFLAGIISLAIWVYLLLARGRFWRITPRLIGQISATQKRLVAVIPARNEADVIGRSVTSLLRQQGVSLNVVLVDDASADGTADIARSVAAELCASDRLEVITGKSLPVGWSGKLWAVQQGIEAAAKHAPDFLLLTDADIEHDAGNLCELVDRAERDGLDLASLMVKLHCETVPEKLLIPAFVFFFFKLYPPAWIADRSNRTAGAAGGCMLIRTSALERAGGIQAIRGEIIDDCSLATRVKHSGGKVWLSLTDSARSVRPYKTFGEIGRMISRTAFNQLKHSVLLLVVALFGLIFTYVAPVGVLFSGRKAAVVCGGIAFALMMIAYTPMVRFYRLNPLWALTLPVAAVFYMVATIRSAINYWTGRGGQWKGRVQDSAGTTHA